MYVGCFGKNGKLKNLEIIIYEAHEHLRTYNVFPIYSPCTKKSFVPNLKTSNCGLECDNLFPFHTLSDIVTEKEKFLNKIHLIGVRV